MPHSQPVSLPPEVSSLLADSSQSKLSYALEVLDNSSSLSLLQCFQESTHELCCQMAQIYNRMNEMQAAEQTSLKAIILSDTICKVCPQIYCNSSKQAAELKEDIQKYFPYKSIEFVQQLRHKLKSKQLMAYLQKNGAHFPKITLLAENIEQRKVVSSQSILPEQIIMRVPLECLITLEMAKSVPVAKEINAKRVCLKSPKHTLLAIFLLLEEEKGESSEHACYIRLLPKEFSHFPLNYDAETTQLLIGSLFLDQMQCKQGEMLKDYEMVVEIDPAFTRFTYPQFKRMRMVVSSRVFAISIAGQRTEALVPMADMLNHSVPRQTSWAYCDKEKGFIIKALREIPAGEEIYDSYGVKCNSRFLLNYGFIIPNNQSNEVSISVPLTAKSSENQCTLYLRLNTNIEDKLFKEALAAFRFASTQIEGKSDAEINPDAIRKTPFSGVQEEIKAWTMFQAEISRQIECYPTTLREDKQLIKHEQNFNRLNCILLRKGQKQILSFYQSMGRKILKLLSKKVSRADGGMQIYEAYLASIGQ